MVAKSGQAKSWTDLLQLQEKGTSNVLPWIYCLGCLAREVSYWISCLGFFVRKTQAQSTIFRSPTTKKREATFPEVLGILRWGEETA